MLVRHVCMHILIDEKLEYAGLDRYAYVCFICRSDDVVTEVRRNELTRVRPGYRLALCSPLCNLWHISKHRALMKTTESIDCDIHPQVIEPEVISCYLEQIKRFVSIDTADSEGNLQRSMALDLTMLSGSACHVTYPFTFS